MPIKIVKFITFSFLSFQFLVGCTHEQANSKRAIASPSDQVNPKFDLPLKSDLGEHLVEGELESIAKLFSLIRGHMERHYGSQRTAFRAVHAKATGCAKATFTVKDDIDRRFKFGVFSKARTYDAFVRFSNGDGPPENDSDLESRGVGIKLLGVDGRKLLTEYDPYNSQDFLLADQPKFFLPDVTAYALAIAAREGGVKEKIDLATKFPLQLAYRETATRIANPLNAQYWSKTPYQLGPTGVVKFTVQPCEGTRVSFPPLFEKNYMAKFFSDQVAARDTCFDFSLQSRMEGSERDRIMPIEDASVRWDESISPFVKVAQIRIAKGQDVDSDYTRKFCENLSFNPWHALEEQRPLGNLNRVRKIVYDVSSTFRHGPVQ